MCCRVAGESATDREGGGAQMPLPGADSRDTITAFTALVAVSGARHSPVPSPHHSPFPPLIVDGNSFSRASEPPPQ